MIRTQVYLPKELYQEIKLTAHREKKKKAQVIREALKSGLNKKTKKNAGNALLDLAKLGKELGIKGPRDLSVKHDKYLYE